MLAHWLTGLPAASATVLITRLTDGLTAHASYGRSFVLNSGTGRTGSGFAPEEGKGYEIGLSGAWQGIDLAATLFDIEKANILTTDPGAR